MNKVKKFLKTNLKPIMAFIIGFLLSGGVVYATASGYLYDAEEVKFDPTDTNLSSTDVQGALEELNDKAKVLKVGDYFTYELDSTQSYTLSSTLTGYYSSGTSIDQSINPIYITRWRAIGPWYDTTNSWQGFIGVAADGWYNNYIYFKGLSGYINAPVVLNSASSAYSAAGIATGFFPGAKPLIDPGTNSEIEGIYNCENGKNRTSISYNGDYNHIDINYYYGSGKYATCERFSGVPYMNMLNALNWGSYSYSSSAWFNGNAQTETYSVNGVNSTYSALDRCLGSGCTSILTTSYSDSTVSNYLLQTYYASSAYYNNENTIGGYFRPFVEIYSNVKIASGKGTWSNPYVLVAPSS